MSDGSPKGTARRRQQGAATAKPVIELLREDQVAPAFRRMCRSAMEAVVAAPFWGVGAAALLPRGTRTTLRLLCRFDEPACNPSALLPLVKAGARVRSHPRLHAKIYATARQAIIGSSNPSRYGLTQEGDTLGGSIEANVLTDDADVVGAANGLFEEMWSSLETRPITRRDVEREIARRALLPPPPPPPRHLRARTLLAACREAPELFATVHVIAYASGLSEGGKDALRAAQAHAAPPEDDGEPDFRRSWGYQFDDLPPPGSWLLDLNCKGARPRYHGASRIPEEPYRLKVLDGPDVTVTLRGKVTVPGAPKPFTLSAQEKADLASAARRVLKAEHLPLPKVVALIDAASKRRAGKRAG